MIEDYKTVRSFIIERRFLYQGVVYFFSKFFFIDTTAERNDERILQRYSEEVEKQKALLEEARKQYMKQKQSMQHYSLLTNESLWLMTESIKNGKYESNRKRLEEYKANNKTLSFNPQTQAS